MKIAILGWGSLIWDKERAWMLPIENDKWQKGGPVLPIEFARISETRCGALTLVIDPENRTKVPTRFAVSSRTKVDDAICDLRTREGTVVNNIGYVDIVRGTYHCKTDYPQAVSIITKWAKKNFNAVIWTDLRSNFKCKRCRKFSIENALDYLHSLRPSQAEKARKYIKKAPPEIKTPLRKALCEDRWFKRK